jgi:zinc finger HIT domain-containing protein 1
MPLIEELPVTSTNVRASHGWAYVPDTATAPNPAAAQLGSRKRGRDGASKIITAQAAHKLSAKQEKAIQQRLNDLGKENYREANIPIPKRDGPGTGARGKTKTQNVRRILGYNRTFQHYLADEEAGVNVYGAAAATSAVGGPTGTTKGGAAEARRRSSVMPEQQKPKTKRNGSLMKKGGKEKEKEKQTRKGGGNMSVRPGGEDVDMLDAPDGQQAKPEPEPDTGAGPAESTIDDAALDKDPLLRPRDIPKMPSDRVMQALLSEPALSYTAARAKPLEGNTDSTSTAFGMRTGSTGNNLLVAKPQRWFCAVCGYWGKVRCQRGCGERVCGLMECWRGHEGVCPLAGY